LGMVKKTCCGNIASIQKIVGETEATNHRAETTAVHSEGTCLQGIPRRMKGDRNEAMASRKTTQKREGQVKVPLDAGRYMRGQPEQGTRLQKHKTPPGKVLHWVKGAVRVPLLQYAKSWKSKRPQKKNQRQNGGS